MTVIVKETTQEAVVNPSWVALVGAARVGTAVKPVIPRRKPEA